VTTKGMLLNGNTTSNFNLFGGLSPNLIAPSFEAILATRHEALKE